MKVYLVRIVLCIQLVMVWAVHDAVAFNDAEAGGYLWRLINEARAKPRQAIEAYQIDYARARQALGNDFWILDLKNGLPPLAWNDTLAHTSGEHNQDMINRQYYSFTSLEGRTVHERIMDAGYNPVITSESLGLLSFFLYVEPVEAVESLFENMLKDELNPDTHNGLNIFGRDFTEIGISFISTVFSWDAATTVNAYVLTADFAKPAENRSYILGNVFSRILDDSGRSSAANGLLGATGWRPEKTNDNFILFMNNLNEGWGGEVSHGVLASFQVQVPSNTYYILDCYGKHLNVLPTRIVDVGIGVNRLLDFEL